ncbi:MAG: ECF-type sigma factor, partial [Saprospiraceae bacterium]
HQQRRCFPVICRCAGLNVSLAMWPELTKLALLEHRFNPSLSGDVARLRFSMYPDLIPHEASASAGTLTTLLRAFRSGDQHALQQIFVLTSPKLRQLGSSLLLKENPAHTLEAAILVNESYLRLFCGRAPAWENSSHFFGSFYLEMKRFLIDYARRKRAKRRYGGVPIELTPDLEPRSLALDVPLKMDLDRACLALSAVNPRAERIVQMWKIEGRSAPEIALALGVTTHTVERDWKHARAWLARYLSTRKTSR